MRQGSVGNMHTTWNPAALQLIQPNQGPVIEGQRLRLRWRVSADHSEKEGAR